MTNIEKNIWGRILPLRVTYDCLDDEKVLPSQERALSELLNSWFKVDNTLNFVKEYCEKNSYEKIKAADIDNIFKYVMPTSLFVIRNPEDSVALMCDFRFDIEHGIALVFHKGKLERIDTQDSVL